MVWAVVVGEKRVTPRAVTPMRVQSIKICWRIFMLGYSTGVVVEVSPSLLLSVLLPPSSSVCSLESSTACFTNSSVEVTVSSLATSDSSTSSDSSFGDVFLRENIWR